MDRGTTFRPAAWFLAVAVLATAMATPSAAGGGAEEIARAVGLLDRLEARYAALPPFTTRFRQSLESPTFGEEEQARGTILVGRGGRIAWNYDEPPGMRAVFDGREWRLLDPEERELVVRRTDLPGREGDRLLAELLAGRVHLVDLFAVVPGEEARPGAPGRVTIRLVPREPRDDLDWIELAVDPAPPDLRRVVVVDPLGSRLVVELGPPVPARDGIPEGAFEIEAPGGYTITRD